MKTDAPRQKNIVVVGGGTGTHTVLSGLKHYVPRIRLSAVVGVSDSGGSTGRLRDEFGHLPVGDTRMALVALANESGEYRELLRDLFLYRFDKGGESLKGHNFGNLFLTALTEILGSEEAAIRVAGKMLRVCGRVFPVASEHLSLVAEYDDGVTTVGEAQIDTPKESGRDAHRIVRLSVNPPGMITDAAREALMGADTIVIGPGDLYTSILAVCVVGGVADTLQSAPGTLVYVSNLMTRYGQTTGFSVAAHVAELERYISRRPDVVVVNTKPLPQDLLEKYVAVGEAPVVNDGSSLSGNRIIEDDLLREEEVVTARGDVLRRSFIRHDPEKLASVIVSL